MKTLALIVPLKLIPIFTFFLLFITSCSSTNSTENKKDSSGTKILCAEKAVCEKIIAEEDVTIIDVRTPEEYKTGHLENAINLNFYEPAFEAELAKLEKDNPTIVYCAVGGRSAEAVKKMEEMGFSYIVEIKGGYNAWQKQ